MDPRTTRAGLSRQATPMSIYQIEPDVVGEWATRTSGARVNAVSSSGVTSVDPGRQLVHEDVE